MGGKLKFIGLDKNTFHFYITIFTSTSTKFQIKPPIRYFCANTTRVYVSDVNSNGGLRKWDGRGCRWKLVIIYELGDMVDQEVGN